MLRPTLLILLIVCVVPVYAQPGGWSNDDDDDEFTRDLEEQIDSFLERVTHGITSGDIDGIFLPDTIERKPRRSIRTADLEMDAYSHSYSGDTFIPADDVLKGNVIVKGGDLEVEGTIDGDVLVIGGTLYVLDDGVVTGNARVINGDIVKREGGEIKGHEDSSTGATTYRAERTGFRRFGTSFDVPWLLDRTNIDNVQVRYNRVEGLFFGLGSEKKYYWDGRRHWSAFGGLGWGIASHTWRYNLGLVRQFDIAAEAGHLFELGIEGYSLTDSKDTWILSTNENSAAAFFIHEDFLDFYERRGFTGHAAWYTQGSHLRTEVRVAYVADSYSSLEQRTDWALFGGNKVFRPNPPIQAGRMRSVVVSAGLTTLDKSMHGPEGWSVHLTAELGKNMPGSDFAFNTYLGDLRCYQPIGRHDNLNIRLRVATAEGVLPPQKMFEIGGLGTLNAYRYKMFAGNRMLLLNAEYILDGDFLDELDFWPTSILSGFTFIFLSDAGLVRTVVSGEPATGGFGGIDMNEFAHNFGFGISNRSGRFRLAYTWRTDIKAPGNIIFRFARPF